MLLVAKEQSTVEQMRSFNQMVAERELTNFHLRKPLLDGKTICSALGVKPGKGMKDLVDKVTEF